MAGPQHRQAEDQSGGPATLLREPGLAGSEYSAVSNLSSGTMKLPPPSLEPCSRWAHAQRVWFGGQRERRPESCSLPPGWPTPGNTAVGLLGESALAHWLHLGTHPGELGALPSWAHTPPRNGTWAGLGRLRPGELDCTCSPAVPRGCKTCSGRDPVTTWGHSTQKATLPALLCAHMPMLPWLAASRQNG